MSDFITFRKPRHEREDDQPLFVSKGTGVLSTEMEELSGIYYHPRTKETREIYEVLLSFLQQCIGDQVRYMYVHKLSSSLSYGSVLAKRYFVWSS